MNHGHTPPTSAMPDHRKSDIFDILREEREMDKDSCYYPNADEDFEMLARLNKDCKVTPVGFLPFTTFSSEDLFASMKTICEDYNKAIRNNHIKNIK